MPIVSKRSFRIAFSCFVLVVFALVPVAAAKGKYVWGDTFSISFEVDWSDQSLTAVLPIDEPATDDAAAFSSAASNEGAGLDDVVPGASDEVPAVGDAPSISEEVPSDRPNEQTGE